MNFLTELERARSCKGNIKNWSWDVEPCYKLYEEEGRAIVAYINQLENRIKELEEQIGEKHE